MELKPLPNEIQQQIKKLEDLPNYLNRQQLAVACGVQPATTLKWLELPQKSLNVGGKFYWLPETIMPFILEYRKSQAPK